MATPEQHKSRLRYEAIKEIVELMSKYDVTWDEIREFKSMSMAEQLLAHRQAQAKRRQHADNLVKAREAAAAKRQAKQEKHSGTEATQG